MLAPCKDCKERKVGCHSTCEAYKEFQRQNDDTKANRSKESEANAYVISSHMLVNKKTRKRKK